MTASREKTALTTKMCDGIKDMDVPIYYRYNNKLVFYTYDDDWDDEEVVDAAQIGSFLGGGSCFRGRQRIW